MYCRNCGKSIKFNDYFCEYCGARTDIVDDVKIEKEKNKFGYGVLAFFIPIVGIILYFSNRKIRPKLNKPLLIGTISGFIFSFISIILSVILLISLFNKNMYTNEYSSFGEAYSVVEVEKLKLMKKEDGRGNFVLSTASIQKFSGFYEIEYGGEVEVSSSYTETGTWVLEHDRLIKLTTYEFTVQYDFSKDGKEKFKEEFKSTLEVIYGDKRAVDSLLNEEALTFTYNQPQVSYVILNEKDKTFLKK